jgi:predicted component of type VI protein secretion system
MTYQLIPIDKGNRQPIPLQRPVLLIGRHPECDIRIELPKISRRHCCVAIAYDRVIIRDLGSRNGVRVNGEIVDESRLVEGDEVAIGPLIYRLVGEAVQPAAPPRPAPLPLRHPPEPALSAGQTPPPHSAGQPVEETDLVPLDDLD